MITLTFPLAALIIGALLYGFSPSARVNELGRILFFVGSFWLTYGLAGKGLHFP